MPEVTVDINVRIVGPNEVRYKFRLLWEQPSKSDDSEDDSGFYYIMPSRTNIRPSGVYKIPYWADINR